MSKDEDFDNIINNMGDEDTDEEDFDHPIDVVAHYWKHFHKGHIFTKGILIVESETSTGRRLQFETSTPCSEWEVLGMMESVRSQMHARDVVELMLGDEDDDEDGEEEGG